jgi:hypothetical protein
MYVLAINKRQIFSLFEKAKKKDKFIPGLNYLSTTI